MSRPHLEPNRLGFAVKVLGQPKLKSEDARRWQSGPHLRVSLGYLVEIFDYLGALAIRMYRISSNIAPYATHPDLHQFYGQIEECHEELARVGAQARHHNIRLSLHPAQYVVLNSPHEHVAQSAVRDFTHHAALLDALGCGLEAKIVTHVGGVYGDRISAVDRFVARYKALPERVRHRLVLENDETSYSVADIVSIHERTGVPLVFDILHHRINNPARLTDADACRCCLATWPPEQMPKMHFSSPRAAACAAGQSSEHRKVEGKRSVRPGQHADWIDATEFITFVTEMGDARFDIMLEAKQKDLALLRLREALREVGLQNRIW